MRNRGANLGLDVVPDDRDASVGELLGPDRVGGDEYRQRVHERYARVDGTLRVETVSLLGTHRQVRHQHVRARIPEHLGNIHRRLVRLGDDLLVVLAQAVHRRPALHRHAAGRHVADFDGVVLAGDNCLGDVTADLLGVDVEGGDELYVADVIRAELDMHKARYPARRVSVLVVLHALNEGTGTVPDAHNGYPYRTHVDCSLSCAAQ